VVVERAPRLQTLGVEALQVGDRNVEGALVVERGLASQSVCKLFPAQVWWCNACQDWQYPGWSGTQTASNTARRVI